MFLCRLATEVHFKLTCRYCFSSGFSSYAQCFQTCCDCESDTDILTCCDGETVTVLQIYDDCKSVTVFPTMLWLYICHSSQSVADCESFTIIKIFSDSEFVRVLQTWCDCESVTVIHLTSCDSEYACHGWLVLLRLWICSLSTWLVVSPIILLDKRNTPLSYQVPSCPLDQLRMSSRASLQTFYRQRIFCFTCHSPPGLLYPTAPAPPAQIVCFSMFNT
jgi:hypothetical protein